MHGLSYWIVLFHHSTHPINDQPGQMPDLIAIVNDQPSHWLYIVARWGESRNVNKFGEDLAFDGPLFVRADGPAGA
jgi:hypothetical protein